MISGAWSCVSVVIFFKRFIHTDANETSSHYLLPYWDWLRGAERQACARHAVPGAAGGGAAAGCWWCRGLGRRARLPRRPLLQPLALGVREPPHGTLRPAGRVPAAVSVGDPRGGRRGPGAAVRSRGQPVARGRRAPPDDDPRADDQGHPVASAAQPARLLGALRQRVERDAADRQYRRRHLHGRHLPRRWSHLLSGGARCGGCPDAAGHRARARARAALVGFDAARGREDAEHDAAVSQA